MAAKRIQPPRRWDCGTISTNFDGIWEMSVEPSDTTNDTHPTFCYAASMLHSRRLTIIATVVTEKLNA